MEPIELSVHEFANWRDGGREYFLLDVRDIDEVAFCRISDSVHISQDELISRKNELPDDVPIVVYCHHGRRSYHSGIVLKDLDFDEVYNLTGGIDEFSREIDPSIPRYERV